MTKLLAKKREAGSKAENVRKDGQIPGVLYGKEVEAIPVSVDMVDLVKILKESGESSVFDLELDGKEHEVLIQDIGQDPVSGRMLSIDFLAIKKGQTITVEVPLKFIGESPAVKSGLGVLTKLVHELEVETTPKNLPKEIEVDISALVNLHDSITIADLKIPAGVTPELEGTVTVVTIAAQKEEKEEEAAVEPDFSKIEVEQKGKKEEAPAEEVEAKE